MNFLDILIAIPLCFFIYKGWRRGLVFEVAALAGIVVGVWACVHFSTWVAEKLQLQSDSGVLIAFFITFAAVVVLAYFLGKAIEGIFKMVKLNFLNKILGALLGMAKCLCVISVLLNFILLIDTGEIILTPTVKEESVLFKPSYRIGNKMTATLKAYVIEQRDQLAEQKQSAHNA
jgi:membrane protein required for colicin V production